MYHKFKKIVAIVLVFCMFFQNINCLTFAQDENYQAQKTSTIQMAHLKTRNGLGFAIPAGIYFIPGIGQVLIEVTGAIIVAGIAIEVGSRIYNTIVDWFESENQKDADYEDAKEKGTPTSNHDSGSTDQPGTRGEPRSSREQKNPDGSIKQRRYYDKNGNADMDIDYGHGGVGHPFPHRHYWKDGKHGDWQPF